jgi:hypothetical protein
MFAELEINLGVPTGISSSSATVFKDEHIYVCIGSTGNRHGDQIVPFVKTEFRKLNTSVILADPEAIKRVRSFCDSKNPSKKIRNLIWKHVLASGKLTINHLQNMINSAYESGIKFGKSEKLQELREVLEIAESL